MKRTPKPMAPFATAREPLQIYMTVDERAVLDRLAEHVGVSRAEILRRGLRSYAAEQLGHASPMLKLMQRLQGNDWPEDIGREHDAYLAQSYETASTTKSKWQKPAPSSSTRRRGSRR